MNDQGEYMPPSPKARPLTTHEQILQVLEPMPAVLLLHRRGDLTPDQIVACMVYRNGARPQTLPKALTEVLDAFLVRGLSLTEAETEFGWPIRSGKAILKIALSANCEAQQVKELK